MTPYVYARETPDEGIAGFLDYARYSSGYAALHHTISFMPETHMLKSYSDRVLSTYAFMKVMIEYLKDHGEEVRNAREKSVQQTIASSRMNLDWQLDPSRVDSFLFKGFEAAYKPSAVSGLSRLYYDQNKPYEKQIPFYDSYKVSKQVEVPAYYIIPQAYDAVIDRLKWNNVAIERLTEDEKVTVQAYYIESFENQDAYEGHYMHKNIKVRSEETEIQFYKGDYRIKVDQISKRYIVETLEPEAPDGFFAWNFFDGILMQKEYFSPYVFEDLAADILKENPDLLVELEARRSADDDFAQNAYAQLEFIYKRSPYYEKTHNRFPVYRIMR